MKKVILFLSAVATLCFVSCAKQSLGYGGDEMELVIEELEGSATKAALTDVALDTYGYYKPKKQVLTAKLRYKSSGADVTGEGISYEWAINCNGAATRSPIPNRDDQINLIASKAGSGTVSVSATYKGQEVQSSDLPVSVTSYDVPAFTCILRVMHPVVISEWPPYPHNSQSADISLLQTPGAFISSDPLLSISVPDFKNVSANLYYSNRSVLVTPELTYDTNYFGEHIMQITQDGITFEKTFTIEDNYEYGSVMLNRCVSARGLEYYEVKGKCKDINEYGDPTTDINYYLENGEFFVVVSNPDGSNPQVLQKTTLTDGVTTVPVYGYVPTSYNSYKVRLYHMNNVLAEIIRTSN